MSPSTIEPTTAASSEKTELEELRSLVDALSDRTADQDKIIVNLSALVSNLFVAMEELFKATEEL